MRPIKKSPESWNIRNFISLQHERGRYWFTFDEIATASRISPAALRASLRRFSASGRIIRVPARPGFFVIVPPEYAAYGAPPSTWFIDAYMKHLGRPYYLALLSAAELLGASHQASQYTQVIIAAPLRSFKVGREHIRFIVKNRTAQTPVQRIASQGGYLSISTPAATAIDLVIFFNKAAGWSNIATLLKELHLDRHAALIGEALDAANDVSAAQRLGYLLEVAGQNRAANAVARWLTDKSIKVRLLETGGPPGGPMAERWRIRANVQVETEA